MKSSGSMTVKTFITVVLMSVCMAHAQKPANAKITPEQRAAKRAIAQKRVMEMHGGILENKGKGAMAIVNCQSRLDIAVLDEKIRDIKKLSRMEARVVQGRFSLEDVQIPQGYNIAMFIVDDPKLPMSLVSVESKWGMMNVASLYSENTDASITEKRFRKQFVRIAVLTFGGGVSQYRGSPLQPVFSGKDLDGVTGEGFTIDTMSMFIRNLGALGMTQTKRATYRKACEEGWAPPPTNEYQRAVFNQVKADKERGPTNPIEIPMPKKK